MKHWEEGRTESGFGPDGIILFAKSSGRIVSLRKESDDESICITEECDGYFSMHKTKEEMIEALQEAIEWIKEQ